MKTAKKILLLITLSVMMILQISAQNPTLEWVVQIGGTLRDKGNCIAVDQNGNILTTGNFTGNAICTFPVGDPLNLNAIGTQDVFIQKLGPGGSHIWTMHCGGSGTTVGMDVTTDPAGNVIVVGNFSGTVDFDPGPAIFNMTNMGNEYIGTATFVMKLDANGNFLWAKQTEPVYGGTAAMGFTRDAAGNLLISGYFGGKIDFDPGSGTAIHTTPPEHGPDYQAFILKLDANGNFLWVNELGGSGTDYGYSVTTDASLNVYTTGSFQGIVDFDPSKKGVYKLTSIGNTDAFIQKSDQTGKFVWAKQIGGTGGTAIQVITTDASGNMISSGWFSGTADFDPGTGTYNLTSPTSSAFIQKLNSSGNLIWVKNIEGTGPETNWSGTWGITADASGNIYTTGYFGGSADFDPGPSGTYIKTCIDTVDCYVLKLDGSGNFQWAQQIGGENGYNCGLGIVTDPSGNVYTTGFFAGDASGFDPANPEFQLHSSGYWDSFLQKLSQGAICNSPSGLIATNISYYSATLNWNAVGGAVSYNVQYHVNGSGNWITESGISNTSLLISGLAPMTVYEFQVQTNCGESQSLFSPSATFTTLGQECIDNYEPNEIQGSAKTISVNTNIRAMIAVSSDVDWFKFNNANNKKNIKITLTNLPANYDVALYNAAGAQLAISQNPGTADEMIIYNTSVVGTYYIKVYGNSGVYDPFLCYALKAAISSSGFKSLGDEENIDPYAVEMSVYPNPASTKLDIEYTSVSDVKTILRLVSISGQVKVNREINSLEGHNKYSLDLSDIPNGMYFVELLINDQRIFRKVVVSK